MNNNDSILTTAQVAIHLDVAVSTVHYWKATGQLTPCGRSSRGYWYTRSGIETFLAGLGKVGAVPGENDRWLTARQAAAFLDIPITRVRSLDRGGHLVPVGRSVGNRRRYSETQLKDFLSRLNSRGLGPRANEATLTRAEAAAEIGVSVRQLQRWEHNGVLLPIARNGSTVLYLKNQIAEHITERERNK